MNPLHERLARVGLSAIGRFGFCLAGGYAVQAHGFVHRQSEDVDLFATMDIADTFPDAVQELLAAYRADGLDATVTRSGALFGRGAVRDYIDVDGIMRSGRYPMPRLLELAVEHDPGFRADMFADALLAVRRLPCSAFEAYDMSAADAEALVARVLDYATKVHAAGSP
ncbi:MAG: hypothetical protein GEV00_06595 [Actinophytocola sp.]|nr:hypothetical protein [Actinophytocola sp.]